MSSFDLATGALAFEKFNGPSSIEEISACSLWVLCSWPGNESDADTVFEDIFLAGAFVPVSREMSAVNTPCGGTEAMLPKLDVVEFGSQPLSPVSVVELATRTAEPARRNALICSISPCNVVIDFFVCSSLF